MKRFFKVIVSAVLALCMLQGTVWAAAPEEGAQPNMSILESGKIVIHSGAEFGDDFVEVSVTTSALTIVEKLYHYITVYKNGELIMDNELFVKYNTGLMNTSIDFDAKDGDIFKVVVKHCAKDGSIVESKTTSAIGDY